MELKLSDWIKDFLGELVQVFRDACGENLIGIYLHGSLAMESFNPISSDVDLLVVVRDALPSDEKQAIGERLLRLSEQAPPNGLELSILTLQSLTDFQYPTPYELHFSNGNKDRFAEGTIEFSPDQTDPDLAAHFVITQARGLCLFGAAIDAIFPDVPSQTYLASIAQDADWSYDNVMRGADAGICPVPVYAVLNFCRVLAFIEQGLITSKREGGRWALEALPSDYHPVIREALKEYAVSGTARSVDCQQLKAFAHYAHNIIEQSRP